MLHVLTCACSTSQNALRFEARLSWHDRKGD